MLTTQMVRYVYFKGFFCNSFMVVVVVIVKLFDMPTRVPMFV